MGGEDVTPREANEMALKSGIIGLGSWYSQAFATVLTRIEEVSLVAATYLEQEDEILKAIAGISRSKYARKYGVRLYPTAEEMIQSEDLDMVCVCSDNTSRAHYTQVGARAGKDVFIAKPMASSLCDANKIVNTARNSNVLIRTCNPARFDGAIQEAQRRIAAGEIGEPLTARVLIQHGAFKQDVRIEDTPEFGHGQGGPELSLGFYAADLLKWFIGSEALRVYAEYENLNTNWSPYMDSGKAIVRFRDGKMGSMDIYFSTVCPAPLWEIEVVGRKGIIRTQQAVYEGMLWTTEQRTIPFYRKQNDVLEEEMRSWVNSCLTRAVPDFSIEDAREALEICLSWKESARTRTTIDLPLGN